MKEVIITLVLCFPMVAQNAEKALSFRGFVPGMTFDAFRKAYDARLESEAQKKGNQYATYQFQGSLDCKQLAPGLQRCINAVEGVMADFYYRRLATLYWRFPHDEFSDIREGLIDKFGTHKTQLARIQNRMGAQFDDEILIWSSETATLELSEYVTSLDNSAVTLQDDDLSRSFKKHDPKPSPDI